MNYLTEARFLSSPLKVENLKSVAWEAEKQHLKTLQAALVNSNITYDWAHARASERHRMWASSFMVSSPLVQKRLERPGETKGTLTAAAATIYIAAQFAWHTSCLGTKRGGVGNVQTHPQCLTYPRTVPHRALPPSPHCSDQLPETWVLGQQRFIEFSKLPSKS